jgi:hypothetical protein
MMDIGYVKFYANVEIPPQYFGYFWEKISKLLVLYLQ